MVYQRLFLFFAAFWIGISAFAQNAYAEGVVKIFELRSAKFRVSGDCQRGIISVHTNFSKEPPLTFSGFSVVKVGHKERELRNPVSCSVNERHVTWSYSLQRSDKILGSFDATVSKSITVEGDQLQVHYRVTGEQKVSIKERIVDYRDEIYGGWEFAFGNDLGNRGVHGSLPTRYRQSLGSSVRSPFFFSSRGYGLYIDTKLPIDVAIAQEGVHQLSIEGTDVSYYLFFSAEPAGLLKHHHRLAGPAHMPPLWAFGTMWWRNDATKRVAGEEYRTGKETVLGDARRLIEEKLRGTSVLIDRPFGTGEWGWGNFDFSGQFSKPKRLVRTLNELGYRTVVWIANRAANNLWRNAVERNLLFPGATRRAWPALDLRSREAQAYFRGGLEKFAQLGVSGFKIDRGDEGELPREFENLHAELVPEVAAAALRAFHGEDHFLFSRSLYGKGRQFSAVWSGDPPATFVGLQNSVKHALRSGLLNFPFWGSDTGGYNGIPSEELFVRWSEFSSFTPFMEILLERERKTFWKELTPQAREQIGKQVSQHHILIPYVRSVLTEALSSGMPIMRPLFLAFPREKRIHSIWDQYLYGPSLLVAPILEEGATIRKVVFPSGSRWYKFPDFDSVYPGGGVQEISAPVGSPAVFAREGEYVITGDLVQGNASWITGWEPNLTVHLTLPIKRNQFFTYFDGKISHKLLALWRSHGVVLKIPELEVRTSLLLMDRERRIESITINGRRHDVRKGEQRHFLPLLGMSEVVVEYK